MRVGTFCFLTLLYSLRLAEGIGETEREGARRLKEFLARGNYPEVAAASAGVAPGFSEVEVFEGGLHRSLRGNASVSSSDDDDDDDDDENEGVGAIEEGGEEEREESDGDEEEEEEEEEANIVVDAIENATSSEGASFEEASPEEEEELALTDGNNTDTGKNNTAPDMDETMFQQLNERVSLDEIEKLVLDFVADADEKDEEPLDIEDILLKLSKEYGYSDNVLEEYIDEFPDAGKHIATSFESAIAAVRERKIQGFVDMFLGSLLDELRAGVEMTQILADLGLSLDDLDEALEALNHPDVQAKLEEAMDQGTNKTVAEMEEAERAEFSGRRLGMVVPFEENIDELLQEIDQEYEQRKRARALVMDKMSRFTQKLEDHHEFLDKYHRHLLATCDSSDTKEICTAKKLQDLASNRMELNEKLSSAIQPVTDLFDKFDKSENRLRSIQSVSTSTSVSVKIAKHIPYIGKVFNAVDTAMKGIKGPLDKATSKAKKIEDKVIDKFDRSVGKLLDSMDGFEGALGVAAGVGSFIATAKASQCLEDLISKVGGVDVDSVEIKVDEFYAYSQDLDAKLDDLYKSLTSNPWKGIAKDIDSLVSGLDPLEKFFSPFKPLAALLKKEVKLPWFKPPYKKNKLGSPRCRSSRDVGYSSKLGLTGRSCNEGDSHTMKVDWKSLGRKMVYKCERARMRTDWLNNCKHGDLGSTGVKFTWRGRKCKNPRRFPKRCHFRCYKQRCPRNYSIKCGNTCFPNKRNRKSHRATCGHVERPGVSAELGLLGGCFRRCNPGDSDLEILCFPKAELRVSLKGIFDKLNSVMNAIKNLPIVRTIENAISKLVGEMLSPVTNLINKWLKDADIGAPNLPEFSVDIFPLDGLDNIELPELPEISVDFQAKALKGLTDNVALPFDISSCGTDIDCLAEQAGLGSLEETADEMLEMLESVDFGEVSNVMESVLPGIRCTEWEEKAIPISDVLKMVTGGVQCDSCNIKVPMCKQMEIDGIEAVQANMTSLKATLEPMVELMSQKIERRRRLQETTLPTAGPTSTSPTLSPTKAPTTSSPTAIPTDNPTAVPVSTPTPTTPPSERDFLTLLPIPGIVVNTAFDKFGKPKFMLYNTRRSRKELFGTFIAVRPKVKLQLGLNSRLDQPWYDTIAHNWKDFGIKFRFEVEVQISSTGSINALLQEVWQWVEFQRGEMAHAATDTKQVKSEGFDYPHCWSEKYLSEWKVGELKRPEKMVMFSWTSSSSESSDEMSGSDEGLAMLFKEANTHIEMNHPDFWKCQKLWKAMNLVMARHPKCEVEQLKQWKDTEDAKEMKQAMECVRLWWAVRKEVEVLVYQADAHSLSGLLQSRLYAKKTAIANAPKHTIAKHARKGEWKKAMGSAPVSTDFIFENTQRVLGTLGERHRGWTIGVSGSPAKNMDLGLFVEGTHEHDGRVRFYNAHAGEVSKHAWNDYKELKAELAKEPKVRKKVWNKRAMWWEYQEVTRTPEWMGQISVAYHVDCVLDFSPNSGSVTGPVFMCFGFND